MADAARDQADEHLALAGVGEVDLLHDEWLAELLQHRGSHLHPLTPRSTALAIVSATMRAGG